MISFTCEGDCAITPRQGKHLRAGVEIECSARQAAIGREDKFLAVSDPPHPCDRDSHTYPNESSLLDHRTNGFRPVRIGKTNFCARASMSHTPSRPAMKGAPEMIQNDTEGGWPLGC